ANYLTVDMATGKHPRHRLLPDVAALGGAESRLEACFEWKVFLGYFSTIPAHSTLDSPHFGKGLVDRHRPLPPCKRTSQQDEVRRIADQVDPQGSREALEWGRDRSRRRGRAVEPELPRGVADVLE